MRVLILDDQPGLADLLAAGLTQKDVSVIAFTSPHRALEALNGVDVLLTDYDMPEMNGLEVARRAYASGWRGALLLMSGMPGTLGELSDCPPILGQLRKPFSVDRLLKAVNELPRAAE